MKVGDNMPRQARKKSKSGIYHIIMRGANRQEIFHENTDFLQFLNTLMKYKEKYRMPVYGWCLMNNHVHLLLKEGEEDISMTLRRIGVSFVWYYNWKYATTGHLFQDRFKSECVESGRYLLTVVRYIHQNPVKAGMVVNIDDWKWSSARGYYGELVYPGTLLDSQYVLGQFSDDPFVAKNRFKEFNERNNEDECLEDFTYKRRLLDDEARIQISEMLIVYGIDITKVKTLTQQERNEVFRKVKGIEGVSQRQAARIFGVSAALINKA